MSKKITKWNKGLERGLDYVMDLYEQQYEGNETQKEKTARHKRMAETTAKCIQLIKQCPNCQKWDEEKIRCKLHEECDYPCIDFRTKTIICAEEEKK